MYHTFCNAFTGSSLDMWVPLVDEFRQKIHTSFSELLQDKDGEAVRFGINFSDWTIAFFIDCTSQYTCRPGGGKHHGEDNGFLFRLCQAPWPENADTLGSKWDVCINLCKQSTNQVLTAKLKRAADYLPTPHPYNIYVSVMRVISRDVCHGPTPTNRRILQNRWNAQLCNLLAS
ncbi:MAG: hypothetical protein F6J96_34450 [Symploca sp. SIO1C2]|nr:hypothetical protein [Symploca sp. SIO1C2]